MDSTSGLIFWLVWVIVEWWIGAVYLLRVGYFGDKMGPFGMQFFIIIIIISCPYLNGQTQMRRQEGKMFITC